MILGLSASLDTSSPEAWASMHESLGCKAVVFPCNCNDPEEKIQSFAKAARDHHLTIAEVGVWKNTLSANPDERKEAIDYAIRQLKMADSIGAICCVNIIGTSCGPLWDGGYAGNFSPEEWNNAICMIQHIIDEANPTHTKYSIEPMPWMYPTGPDEYLHMIEDVNREAFGVHMDLINMINCPDRYFFADRFMEDCFTKLKGKILSCHIKDVNLLPELTFQLKECACGKGTISLENYARLASLENENMPMFIEHLHSDEEYLQSIEYVKTRLSKYVK